MRSNLLWLVAIVVVAAMGAWLSRERTAAPSTTMPSASVPTEADVAEARRILGRTDLPQAENERRLVFYNDLRDHMDQRAYGVLEAVAAQLRAAPGYRVGPGYDLKTFYSATGGDDAFKGGGHEDWPRLVAFSTDWLKVVPGSVTARIARGQAKIGGGAQDLTAVVDEMPDATDLTPMDAHEVKMLNVLSHWVCVYPRNAALARKLFQKLGPNVDWRPLWDADQVDRYRMWADGKAAHPEGPLKSNI